MINYTTQRIPRRHLFNNDNHNSLDIYFINKVRQFSDTTTNMNLNFMDTFTQYLSKVITH